ncbi:MAG: hypothetical protein IT424_06170 [Pirellulales bacterium]|nr:hypothetical protein [Pirellulales bacterium]
MAQDDSPFRDCCPRLKELLKELTVQAASPRRRVRLFDLLAEFSAETAKAKSAEEDRQKRREEYFLRHVFAAGNKHLRDGTQAVEGCEFALFSEHSSDNLEHLLEQYYWVNRVSRFRPPNPQRRRRVRVPCCRRESSGWFVLNFYAWAPPEIAARKPDFNARPNAPLPPRNIGRAYTLCEIALGFVVLHDADGGPEPIVPEGHSLYDAQWWWDIGTVRGLHQDSSGTLPFDRWVPDLEPLWGRLKAALEGVDGEPGQGAALFQSLGDKKGEVGRSDAQLFEVDEEASYVRFEGRAYSVRPEGARMLRLLLRANGEWVSMRRHDFSKPSEVKKAIPEPIQKLIETGKGKGYRLKPR